MTALTLLTLTPDISAVASLIATKLKAHNIENVDESRLLLSVQALFGAAAGIVEEKASTENKPAEMAAEYSAAADLLVVGLNALTEGKTRQALDYFRKAAAHPSVVDLKDAMMAHNSHAILSSGIDPETMETAGEDEAFEADLEGDDYGISDEKLLDDDDDDMDADGDGEGIENDGEGEEEDSEVEDVANVTDDDLGIVKSVAPPALRVVVKPTEDKSAEQELEDNLASV